MSESAEVMRASECPVGFGSQAWIEASLSWFAGQFGESTALGQVAIPSAPLIPSPYSATPEQIDQLVGRVCAMMSVDASTITVELFGGDTARPERGRRAVGHYYQRNGQSIIGLDVREASDPAKLIAIIAHELGHVRLLGEGRITWARGDDERLTDLVTVYLGFGVFTTNAALSFEKVMRGWSVQPSGYLDERSLNGAKHNVGYARLGYLSEPEMGYALACYGWLRQETDPAWAAHLDPGPRAYLRQGLAYLRQNAGKGTFPTQVTWHPQVTLRVAPRVHSPMLSASLFSPTSAKANV